MKKEKDISIIEWQPLPAPKDRYLLVRFQDEDGYTCSEMAYSVDGTTFQDDAGRPFYASVEKWAYFPYDTPTSPEDEEFEEIFPILLGFSKKEITYIQKAHRELGMSFKEIGSKLEAGCSPSDLIKK